MGGPGWERRAAGPLHPETSDGLQSRPHLSEVHLCAPGCHYGWASSAKACDRAADSEELIHPCHKRHLRKQLINMHLARQTHSWATMSVRPTARHLQIPQILFITEYRYTHSKNWQGVAVGGIRVEILSVWNGSLFFQPTERRVNKSSSYTWIRLLIIQVNLSVHPPIIKKCISSLCWALTRQKHSVRHCQVRVDVKGSLYEVLWCPCCPHEEQVAALSHLLVFTRKTHDENDICFIASCYWLERQTYSGYKNNHILTNNTLLLQYWILSGGCNYNTTLNNILIMDLTPSTRG